MSAVRVTACEKASLWRAGTSRVEEEGEEEDEEEEEEYLSSCRGGILGRLFASELSEKDVKRDVYPRQARRVSAAHRLLLSLLIYVAFAPPTGR